MLFDFHTSSSEGHGQFQNIFWEGLQAVTELGSKEYVDMYKDDISYLKGSFTLPLEDVKVINKKTNKKSFKKWCMSQYDISRDTAEWFCKLIASYHGKVSYEDVYLMSFLLPTYDTIVNSILYGGEKK